MLHPINKKQVSMDNAHTKNGTLNWGKTVYKINWAM